MIISHRHKFIFLKTNKTAGTSIEIALSKFCGPDDIITPISPEDEEMRTKLGYPGPQNYFLPMSNEKLFYNHITAKEVKTHIGDQIWNSYYKFCVERNPWDRCVSLYYFRGHSKGPESRPTVTEFLSSDSPLWLKERGFGLYTIDGKVVVDKIYRFENLSQELEECRKQLGIPEKLELPRAKSRFRTDKRHYRDILGEADKARISDLFRDEISLFDYEW